MSATTTVHELVAQPATREALAPFGNLLGTPDLPPIQTQSAFYSTQSALYVPGPIESARPLEWLLYEADPRPFHVQYLERHVELTQAFISLGANPFVVVLARPDAEMDEHDFPRLDEIRAFVVPGNCGFCMHRGTWHEPPYPIVRSTFLMTSHADLTAGLLQPLDAKGEVGKLDVEKRNLAGRAGYELKVRLA